MNQIENEQSDTTTAVAYTWVGHLLEANPKAREERTIVLGGDKSFIHAEFEEHEDGSLRLTVESTGPQSREALSNLTALLASVVEQDAKDYLQQTSE